MVSGWSEETGDTRLLPSSPHAIVAYMKPEHEDSGVEAAIAAAMHEAAAGHVTDPILFVGMRLLQHSERVARMDPLPPPGVLAPSSSSAELHAAELELAALRAELHAVELAEATKAMQVLLGESGRRCGPLTELEQWVLADAAITIQAAFHGMHARRWLQDLRAARGALRIQAGLRGMAARQWRQRAFADAGLLES